MSKDETGSVLADKWVKLVNKMPDFKDTADAASEEDLKKMIVDAEGNIYVQEQTMAEDTKLNAAKEIVKDNAAPYREAIKFQMAKIKYALFLLEGKGVDLEKE